MPSLYYRVEAPGVNILKTVTDEAVAGILNELDLTRYFTESVYTMSSFMASSSFSDSNDTPTLTKNRCDIEVNYVMDKSQVPWPVDTPYTTTAYGVRSSHKGTHTPILVDEDAGIFIEHRTVACALDMNFTLTFITFDDACKAFDAIQTRYKGSLIQTPFDVDFSYPVSMGLFKYLYAVYKAKTAYQNKTLFDYIADTKKTEISFDIRKSQLTDPNADRELMIRCKQLRCIAQVTMEQKDPEVSREDGVPDFYTVSFNMTLQFGRPDLIAVHTPISVENTLLPAELFHNTHETFHYDPNAFGVYQDLMVDEFMRRGAGDYNKASRILRLPVYDDWLHIDNQYVFHKYRPFLVAHFTLDGPTTVINLKELYTVSLHPIVQKIIAEIGNDVLDYGGLFNIGVYAGTLRLGRELVSIDEDLNLTIRSNRADKEYHFVISETTSLFRTDPKWDQLLIKYRYFFPMTIERNLQSLIDKRYFVIAHDNKLLDFISKLARQGVLKSVLTKMVDAGEDDYQLYHYTQNSSQLADYLMCTQSARQGYTLPPEDAPYYSIVKEYYDTKASVEGRSLFVAFMEQCLMSGHIALDDVSMQYIEPNQTVYPYTSGQGGYYGFNTPLRIINFTASA